jgi:hypothetical protein
VLEANGLRTLLRRPAQQDEPRFEVVLEVWELQRRIKTNFLVCEVLPSLLR